MTKKTRIAMIVDNPINPDPRVLREAIALKELGYCVTIFCQQEDGLLQEENNTGIKIKRVFKYKLGTTVLVDKYLLAHFQLKEAINKEEKFDVFHCHDTETWPLGYIISKEQGAIWIADSHEYFPDYIDFMKELYSEHNKFETAKILMNNRGEYLRFADAVITVSEEMSETLVAQYDLVCLVETIFNSRQNLNLSLKGKNKLKEELGINERDIILAFPGNLFPNRGIKEMIEIFSYLPQNYKLIIMGDGPLVDYIIEKQKNIQRIIYLGKVSYNRLIEVLEICDGIVQFSRINKRIKHYKYSLPNKFFDAIFTNCLFFTFNGSAADYYINKYRVGKVFDCNMSFKDVALEIERSYKDNMVKIADYTSLQKYFSWENQKRKLGALYSNLLK